MELQGQSEPSKDNEIILMVFHCGSTFDFSTESIKSENKDPSLRCPPYPRSAGDQNLFQKVDPGEFDFPETMQ